MHSKVDLKRFAEQIETLAVGLRERPPAPGGILLYGSSTMANWREDDGCYRQLAPLPIVNTGFGGSTAEEARLYYPRLVLPAQPAVMAYYEGANDLMHGYTPEEVLAHTRKLFDCLRRELPGIRFIIVPIKLSKGLDHVRSEGERCNALFAAYAAEHADVRIIDVTSLVHTPAGELRTDIYVEDMLHHTREGYAELARLILPVLEEVYATAPRKTRSPGAEADLASASTKGIATC